MSSKNKSAKKVLVFEPKSEKGSFFQFNCIKLVCFYILGRLQMEKVLLDAVIQSNVDLVAECLAKNIDPNIHYEDGEAPLHIAVQKGDSALCQ